MPDAIDIAIELQRKERNMEKIRDGTESFEENTNLSDEEDHESLNLDRANLQSSLYQGFQGSEKCMKCDFYAKYKNNISYQLLQGIFDKVTYEMVSNDISDTGVSTIIEFRNKVNKILKKNINTK